MRKKFVLTIGLLCVVTAFILSYAFNREVVTTGPVVQIYPYQVKTILNASGYVVAQRQASLSSKATGRLEWLGVVEGSRVKKGELIALIERDDLRAKLLFDRSQVGLARAELEEAKRVFKRSEQLLIKKYISEASYDESFARLEKAKAAFRAAEAAVAISKADFAQSEIKAPFDGVVLTKNANVGDNITPFSAAANTKGAVVTVADMATLEVEVDISEVNVEKIYVGQTVVVRLDAFREERFFGKVARMVPTIDRSKATRMIKVGFLNPDSRILPDMAAKVSFLQEGVLEEDDKPMLAISKDAALKIADRTYYFVVKNSLIKRREILEPELIGDDLFVVENAKLGEEVVVPPSSNLKDGLKVSIKD